MRKIVSIVIAAVLVLSTAACSSNNSNANKAESKQQKATSNQIIQNQPLPQFNYSQMRQNLIEVETAEAQGAQSTTFFFNLGSRDPIQSCVSVGAPIASTQQLSNPSQIVAGPYNRSSGVIGQLEPNGTYTGQSSGTWTLCIGGNGQSYANYWEGFVQTVFAPAVWDDSAHQIKITGPSSFKFTTGK